MVHIELVKVAWEEKFPKPIYPVESGAKLTIITKKDLNHEDIKSFLNDWGFEETTTGDSKDRTTWKATEFVDKKGECLLVEVKKVYD